MSYIVVITWRDGREAEFTLNDEKAASDVYTCIQPGTDSFVRFSYVNELGHRRNVTLYNGDIRMAEMGSV